MTPASPSRWQQERVEDLDNEEMSCRAKHDTLQGRETLTAYYQLRVTDVPGAWNNPPPSFLPHMTEKKYMRSKKTKNDTQSVAVTPQGTIVTGQLFSPTLASISELSFSHVSCPGNQEAQLELLSRSMVTTTSVGKAD